MRVASLVYVGGMWIVATFIAAVSGTIHSPALLFYIALPISAAWLLGYGAAIWLAVACLLSTLAMVVMDLSKVTLPSWFPNKAIGVWSDVLYAQYSSLNDLDCRGDWDEGQARVGAAQWKVAHLSLDPSGIAAVAAGGGGLVEDFFQHRFMEFFAVPRGE
jgi:hypothetical protein